MAVIRETITVGIEIVNDRNSMRICIGDGCHGLRMSLSLRASQTEAESFFLAIL